MIGNKVYKYIVIDNKNNQKEITVEVTGLNIYIIANEQDLKLFRDAVNANKTNSSTIANQVADVYMNEGKYTINEETGDITFNSDAEQWSPIGTSSYNYKGKYYGNNHTISGIYINGTSYPYGLFGYANNCTIQELKVVNSCIIGRNYVGGIIGYNDESPIKISNCYTNAKINGSSYVGGIIGCSKASGTIIEDCINEGSVLGTRYIGGILGYQVDGSTTNCYNEGFIRGDQRFYSWNSW